MSKTPITDAHGEFLDGYPDRKFVPAAICRSIEEDRADLIKALKRATLHMTYSEQLKCRIPDLLARLEADK